MRIALKSTSPEYGFDSNMLKLLPLILYPLGFKLHVRDLSYMSVTFSSLLPMLIRYRMEELELSGMKETFLLV